MSQLCIEQKQWVRSIMLDRPEKKNAFDDQLLIALLAALKDANSDPNTRIIILSATGNCFSAGADLAWMQRMANMSELENITDAKILAAVLAELYHSPKPTLAAVQGLAFGGGVGLVAACDIAIAAEEACFCFSEVKLGLIPAVISPYVVKAIGQRQASRLFMTATTFDVQEAKQLGLIHQIVKRSALDDIVIHQAQQLAAMAPNAVIESKALARDVAERPLSHALSEHTAGLIAAKRISEEGQKGLQAFLNKQTPKWD